RFQLVKEPESLLSERERKRAVPRDTHKRERAGCLLPARFLDTPGQTGNRGRFEQRPQREFALKGRAYARNHLGRQQGVSAQREEVVVNSYSVHPQRFPPYLRQTLL